MDAFHALARELEGEPVVRAYVFGSFAEDTAGPRSDVDLAVWPHTPLDGDGRMRLQARLSLAAAAAFGVDRADVVLLDEAPPALAFEAIQGRLVLDRDPPGREVMEARIMSQFHDRAPREDRWAEETLRRYLRGEFA